MAENEKRYGTAVYIRRADYSELRRQARANNRTISGHLHVLVAGGRAGKKGAT